MPSTQNSANGQKTMDFNPGTFDVEAIEPDAPIGAWIADGRCKKNLDKDKNPRIILEWTLKQVADDNEENEVGIGKKIGVFYSFPKPGAQFGNMRKLELRKLCEFLDVPLNLTPKEYKDWEDFQPLMDAIDEAAQEKPIWTWHKAQESGEVRVNIAFTAPNTFESTASDEEEEDDKPKAKAKAAPAGKGKTAAKTGRR